LALISSRQLHTLQQLQSGELTGIKHLKLSCGLTRIPDKIFELAGTLEILDLSGNQLSSLPDEFIQLKKLRILFLSDNNFTTFPKILFQFTQLSMIGFKSNQISIIPENALPLTLRWLILTNNQLEYIPKSIGNCKLLQKVMLAGNQLKELPSEMVDCKKIELLRISANHLYTLPDWLFSLPRLSWLAFAGNEFGSLKNSADYLPDVDWNRLKVLDVLGQGASGIIAKAIWTPERAVSKEVAIKVFKGEVTSDGFPLDEMKACVHTGPHPNLIPIIGKIKDHPEQKSGLVLELISSSFKNLGGPPDFETCTRDIFPADTFFSLKQIIRITSGIADVVVQLHSRGIMHGDLYAHNILVTNDGETLLSDFGAACHYDVHSKEALKLQRLEVRAFGCLLEDLLSRIQVSDQQQPSAQLLRLLLNECIHENLNLRPDFCTIRERIEEVSEFPD
jgi:hypothetical protein